MGDNFEKTVNFTYTKGEGDDVYMLGDKSNTNAKLDLTYHHGSEGQDYGLTLIHPNYLHTKFLNVREVDGQVVYSERICDFFDQSLEEYVNSLGGQILTGTYWINGVEEAIKIIKPKIKDIIRSMISFVLYIHSKRLTFKSKLDYRKHFGILEGVLKFWRISFSRSTRHNDRKADFYQIGNLIKKNILHGINEPFPEYLGDLLELMSPKFSEHWHTSDYLGPNAYDKFTVNVEGFFPSHISLMSSREKLSFIMNCHNMVDCLKDTEHTRFRNAVLNMGNNKCWVDKLEYSLSVLHTSIVHGILKADKPEASLAEAKNLVANLSIPEYLNRVRQRYTVVNRSTFSVNRDILSVCRNVATHSYGVVKEIRGNNYKLGADVEIDVAIMETFGDLLILLQKELFKRNLLPHFMG